MPQSTRASSQLTDEAVGLWEPSSETTTFWALARTFPGGIPGLLKGWTNTAAIILAVPVVVLTATGDLDSHALDSLATAYLAAAAALFGVILAGLTVFGAFVAGRTFKVLLDELTRLRDVVTGYYWVAAIAVSSLVATVVLVMLVNATEEKAVWSVAIAVATFLFMSALFNALWLVGFTIRVTLYGAFAEARKRASP